MGKHSDPSKEKKNSVARNSGGLDSVLVIQLIVAVLIFAVALIVKMPSFLKIVLLVISAAAAGYDVALDAVDAVENKDYFATSVIVIFVTVLAFIINYPMEAAALMMLYKIGLALIAYADGHTRKTARELLQYQDEETVEKAVALMEGEKAGETKLENSISHASSTVLKGAIVFALLFAVLVPILTNLTFRESIHRALTIILLATPSSVVLAIPLTYLVGLGYGAQYGVLYRDAATMEKMSGINTGIFDKTGVLSDEAPKLVSIQSDILDTKTFMDFISHAVYYSEQPFAKAISAASDQDYKLELIHDFVDIPGCGVDLSIGGAKVTLATRELYASRGEAVPYETTSEHLIYYLMVSGKYIGKVEISDDLREDAAELMSQLKEIGVEKCVLLAEEGKEESERLGTTLNADEVYAECDTDKKIKLIQKLSESPENNSMFVYANGIETHSAAEIDLRVSRKGKFADVLVVPEYLGNLPAAIQLCRRAHQIAVENAVFAFAVKALLVFLSIIGRCNLWFAIFIDMSAALATILNTIRVTQDPLIDLSKSTVAEEEI